MENLKENKMQQFLKVCEAPKTKLQLKKSLLSGELIAYENNDKLDSIFREIRKENLHRLIDTWSGLLYAPKYQGQTNEASACLGTSYSYIFAKAK